MIWFFYDDHTSDCKNYILRDIIFIKKSISCRSNCHLCRSMLDYCTTRPLSQISPSFTRMVMAGQQQLQKSCSTFLTASSVFHDHQSVDQRRQCKPLSATAATPLIKPCNIHRGVLAPVKRLGFLGQIFLYVIWHPSVTSRESLGSAWTYACTDA